MNVYLALTLDLPLAGKLAGDHLAQAALDMEAADYLATLTRYPGKELPEVTVCDFFAALFCNPKLDSYRFAEPLNPSAPVPGLSLLDRTKREMLRWYQLSTDYVPVPISDSENITRARRHVRLIQLSTAHEAVQKRYAAALGIPADEVQDIADRLKAATKETPAHV